MSWEGYGCQVCENGCFTYFDPYNEDPSKCPECGGEIKKSILCDETNGYDEDNNKREEELKAYAFTIVASSKKAREIRIKNLIDRKEKMIRGHEARIRKIDEEIKALEAII